MCGIYGILGSVRTEEIIEKLKKLEYRGYDSCGIAYIYKNRAIINKVVGASKNLVGVVDSRIVDNAIGHTRWATHGRVTPLNAHPHSTYNKRYILVHNGVIENYQELIHQFALSMATETDTEVLVHLLDIFSTKLSTLDCIKKVMSLIEGNYAVVFIDKKNPKRLYFMKNKSPLLIAKTDKLIEISSDQNAFESYSNVTILNDFDYGYLEKDDIHIISQMNVMHDTFFRTPDQQVEKVSDYYMYDEIKYQGTMIKRIVSQYPQIQTKDFFSRLCEAEEIVFIGAGSSYYAACYLAPLYEKRLKKRCFCLIASEVENFMFLSDKTVCIFLSQSGETADLIKAMNDVKQRKYFVIAMCNHLHSTLCYQSDMVFPLLAGPEIAVASTKAFTAMLVVGELLINKEEKLKSFERIGDDFDRIISNLLPIKDLAKNISGFEKVFFLARGQCHPLALEAALKLREISYKSSFAFYSGELKHGSIALIDDKTIIIGFLSRFEDERFIISNLEETKSRGGTTILVSTYFEKSDFLLPQGELSMVFFLQFLAFYTALELKQNIDQPRNLAKSVTVY